MDGFSSATRLTDLSDLNQSSQLCINPVQIEKSNQKKRAIIELEDDGSYIEIDNGKKSALPTATVSLNDCLACSGCVTSAESILIAAQSTTEFYQNLNKGHTVVVSISPQSRASVATYFGISTLQAHKKLITLFKKLGVSYVFDTSFSREFSLLESAAEFVARKKGQLSHAPLPLLASACPGWICYAEKSQEGLAVPYISTTKSPQQIMGSIVKFYFSQKINKKPEEMYHVAIMPCFDKKLEASRDDFYSDIYKTHDVDCVLSSLEILDILKDKSIDFPSLEESPIDNLFTNIHGDTLYGTKGGSGGYLEYIFKYAAKTLFNVDVTEMKYTQGRTADFKEVTLEVGGQKVLHFAQMYSFKNINTLMRKIKDKKCPYDFVEVMACPSGCVNGGGQLRSSTKESPKALLARVEAAYNEAQHSVPEQNEQAMELYRLWKSGPFDADPHTSLHTKYHIREKLVNPLAIGW